MTIIINIIYGLLYAPYFTGNVGFRNYQCAMILLLNSSVAKLLGSDRPNTQATVSQTSKSTYSRGVTTRSFKQVTCDLLDQIC